MSLLNPQMVQSVDSPRINFVSTHSLTGCCAQRRRSVCSERRRAAHHEACWRVLGRHHRLVERRCELREAVSLMERPPRAQIEEKRSLSRSEQGLRRSSAEMRRLILSEKAGSCKLRARLSGPPVHMLGGLVCLSLVFACVSEACCDGFRRGDQAREREREKQKKRDLKQGRRERAREEAGTQQNIRLTESESGARIRK